MIFSLGFINFHWYGFFVGLGTVLGYLVVLKRAKLYQVPSKDIEALFFYAVIGGLIGARIYHALDKWGYYSKNLIQIIAVWNGGLAIYGAIIGGIVGIFLYKLQIPNNKFQINSKSKIQNNKTGLLKYLDLIVPGLALGQGVGRIGNFFNQEGFGSPTRQVWGVLIEESRRPIMWKNFTHFHPTFFYESLWMILGFFIMLYYERYVHIYRRSSQNMDSLALKKHEGKIFGLYLIWYGVGRFFLEFLRFDTAKIGTINIAQTISIFGFVLGIYLFKRKALEFSIKGFAKNEKDGSVYVEAEGDGDK